MTQTHICSGLGWREPCLKRDHCTNYVHWTLDCRSEFNACHAISGKLKHFIQIGTTVPTAKPIPQQELFA